ncbi:TcpQ domain-containing protein [Serratia symbiotica]|uniref:TcpQ domain-containing protein n=1 Tax=Serratia symbiotica TaxID=138074 RepID=UPI0013252F39|nr:TcpQ domain-containing protein [Serratia symbiotica]QTP13351.1 toxin co-regulated pilus biosynthesis Q family protein [Serratia symbiotica]
MKQSVSASLLAVFAYCSVPSAFAGFDVIPSYEYTGAKPPVIQTTKALQNSSPDKNIFIDEPNKANQFANTGNQTTAHMLPSASSSQNNSFTPKPAFASTMPASEVQALMKSLNHITFIGTPPPSIQFTSASGSSSNLRGGMQKIIPTGYGLLLYPSVQKKFGKQHVSWVSGERWLISLDKILDNNHLKAVVDWTDLKVYISEEKEKIVPYSDSAVVASVAQTPGKITNNKAGAQNASKPASPFSNDTSKSQLLKPQLKTALTPDAVKPVVTYQPVTLATWTARSGAMLSTVITEWANTQGWTLIWRTENKDYNIPAPFTVTSKDKTDAGFMEAMKKVHALYESAPNPLKFTLYPDQRLMYVTLKGNN